jgi:hypothetical protein
MLRRLAARWQQRVGSCILKCQDGAIASSPTGGRFSSYHARVRFLVKHGIETPAGNTTRAVNRSENGDQRNEKNSFTIKVLHPVTDRDLALHHNLKQAHIAGKDAALVLVGVDDQWSERQRGRRSYCERLTASSAIC